MQGQLGGLEIGMRSLIYILLCSNFCISEFLYLISLFFAMSKCKANQETAVTISKNQSLSQKAKKRKKTNINDIDQFILDDDGREKDDGRKDEKKREDCEEEKSGSSDNDSDDHDRDKMNVTDDKIVNLDEPIPVRFKSNLEICNFLVIYPHILYLANKMLEMDTDSDLTSLTSNVDVSAKYIYFVPNSLK
ncbi:hypothetical protein RclHR1_31790003 [Rhizophagus clarus]|uniref:Uncharacterized protein n=1 Tax=Rhizophagus clarus TaxID=94130 RepID=A0A2Z6R7P6_9GLOM|nr:hypothetical protein RclHR1_31790003 [Rhizophagus clarus]